MKRNYYLAVIKPTAPTKEYPLRVSKKGLFGNLYVFHLRSERIYASLLSYPGALLLKFVSPFFPFKDEDGTLIKRKQGGHLVIRATT